MRSRGLLTALALALALPLGGCDLFGPSGPGTLEATASADEPLGALVLEVEGDGVRGFVGRGDTRVYGRAIPGGGEGGLTRHRVVLVTPGSGPLRFGIEVEDLGAAPPSVLVVSAVSPENRPSNAVGIQVRVD